jgi:cell wall-associated NlpC family hydrolase
MTQADDGGALIAARAETQLGVPFRLHGRAPGRGLDCIGLAAYSLFGSGGLVEVATNYHLRGHYEDWLAAELQTLGLRLQLQGRQRNQGDLIVFRPSSKQVHLGIVAPGGIIHAHAGLRKIVVTPEPPWSVIDLWRLKGL